MSTLRWRDPKGAVFAELERVSPFLFSLLENSPDFVCMISPDGIIRFVNRAHPDHTVLGLIGRSVFSFLPPETHEMVRACYRRVVETGEPGFYDTPVYVTADEIRRYETHVGPIRQDGEIIALTLIASDISARVEMEQRLRDNQSTLEFAIAATGLGLWSMNVETREIEWDATMQRIHGLDATPADYDGVLKIVYPDDRPALMAVVEESLETGSFRDLEYRIVRPDGSIAWMLARGQALRDAAGKSTRLLGGVLDISARKRGEEALRESEERYRTSIAALEEGIVVQDADSTIHTCNTSAERLLGLTCEQMRSRTSLDPRWRAVHDDGSPFPGDTHPSVVTLTTGEPQSGVIMGVHKPDGRLTWLSINSRALFLGGAKRPSAVVCSFFDITARRDAEAERERLLRVERAARRRAVLLSEASKVLASSLDVTASLEAVVGRVVPEIADLAIVELTDERQEFGATHAVAVAADDPAIATRYRELCRLADHDRRDLLAIVRQGEVRFSVYHRDARPEPLPGVPGDDPLAAHMRYRSTVLVPLSARSERLGVLVLGARARALEPDDLALAEELALRISQSLDVSRLYAEMQTALQKRDEFIAVASHELRTPLMPLMLQLERLTKMCRDVDTVPTATVAPKVQMIARQTDRLHRLVEELLDVSQITGGRVGLELEDLDLVDLIRETVHVFAEQLARAGCHVRLTLPNRVPGRWDRMRIEQIVGNLLANAMKYGAGKPIDVDLVAQADQATLSVRDRGIGISPKDQARVFQRFERAVSERHYGGFGLGLWVTRHVAEAMGGTVSVESVPDAGSTFRITLPRRSPRSGSASAT